MALYSLVDPTRSSTSKTESSFSFSRSFFTIPRSNCKQSSRPGTYTLDGRLLRARSCCASAGIHAKQEDQRKPIRIKYFPDSSFPPKPYFLSIGIGHSWLQEIVPGRGPCVWTTREQLDDVLHLRTSSLFQNLPLTQC